MPLFVLIILLCTIAFLAGCLFMIGACAYFDITAVQNKQPETETEQKSTFTPDILFYDQK